MDLPEDDLNHQLKTVFDLCDAQKCGYISVDQLAELAQQYFGGGEQDMVEILRSLGGGEDNLTGLVSFQQFCNGVKSILAMHRERRDSIASIGSQQSNPASNPYSPMLAPENTAGEKGEWENFTPDSLVGGRLKSSSNHQIVNNNTIPYRASDVEDEHYECYGEASDEDDGDETPHQMVNYNQTSLVDDSRPSRSSSFRSTTSSTNSSSMGSNRSATFPLAPFHRRNSWIRSSIRRSSFGAGKKNLSSSQASQLAKDPTNHIKSHSRQSSRSESGDDMFSGDFALEEDVIDLNEKIRYLQQQLNVLAEGQTSSDDKYSKVKQENSTLTSRILMLEEQLKEIELKSEERLREEQKRTKEMMSKLERDKNLQIENYSIKLMNLEKEYCEVRDEVIRLRSLCERLKEEKASLQEQVLEKDAEVIRLTEDWRKLQELSRREREDFSQERNSNALLLNDLTKELKDLRNYKEEGEAIARARSPSFFEYPSKVRELEADVKVIKLQNQKLKESNEELQAQILNNNFKQGFQILASQAADSSLADEFDQCSKDEIRNALKDQQDENTKLRMYIDTLLLQIMEHDPSMLEV